MPQTLEKYEKITKLSMTIQKYTEVLYPNAQGNEKSLTFISKITQFRQIKQSNPVSKSLQTQKT